MTQSEVPISKTKIVLPRRRPELLRRGRLLDILNDRLDRRLVIVSAPAGYGKTSLLIDLAHESELTFCWLALDPLDQDPQRFVSYMIAAVSERFPQFGARARSVLNGLTSFEDGLEPLLVTLVNEIHDAISEHFVLVLDDFQFLDASLPLQSFINRFVRLMDENCHLILSSRTLPSLQDLTLMVARDEVGGLDFSDLGFRTEEIQALLAQNQQISLSDQDALRLAEATEGWITGIQFADLDMLRLGKSPFQATRLVGVNVFDFLGRQVLEQQSQEVRAFLLRTSMLEEFDVELCRSVLVPLYGGAEDVSGLLETIRQKNLFTLPVGPNGQWLRYHHLFRDYLQTRLRKDHPDEVGPLLRRLAQVREDRGEWESAHQLYRQLGDSDGLANLVERSGDALYKHALLTLEAWLNDLPPSVIRGRPRLLSLRGAVAHVRGNAQEAVSLLTDAIMEFRGGDDTAALARALVRRGYAYRFIGDYERAIQDAIDTMLVTAEADALQDIHANALRLRGLSLFRQGRTLQAMDDLERSLAISQRENDETVIPQLIMDTAMTQAALGEYTRAKASYEKALEIWKQTGNLFHQANLLNNLGFLYYQLGEYERAAQVLEEGLLCAQQSGHRRMEALIHISLGDLYSEVDRRSKLPPGQAAYRPARRSLPQQLPPDCGGQPRVGQARARTGQAASGGRFCRDPEGRLRVRIRPLRAGTRPAFITGRECRSSPHPAAGGQGLLHPGWARDGVHLGRHLAGSRLWPAWPAGSGHPGTAHRGSESESSQSRRRRGGAAGGRQTGASPQRSRGPHPAARALRPGRPAR
jgi:ATP/maltotriose-dependent transcriptional regulator MalT